MRPSDETTDAYCPWPEPFTCKSANASLTCNGEWLHKTIPIPPGFRIYPPDPNCMAAHVSDSNDARQGRMCASCQDMNKVATRTLFRSRRCDLRSSSVRASFQPYPARCCGTSPMVGHMVRIRVIRLVDWPMYTWKILAERPSCSAHFDFFYSRYCGSYSAPATGGTFSSGLVLALVNAADFVSSTSMPAMKAALTNSSAATKTHKKLAMAK